MSDAELIAKQQHEIEELKGKLTVAADVVRYLHCKFHCIGAPLNDNLLKMNNDQLRWCADVWSQIDKIIIE